MVKHINPDIILPVILSPLLPAILRERATEEPLHHAQHSNWRPFSTLRVTNNKLHKAIIDINLETVKKDYCNPPEVPGLLSHILQRRARFVV